MLNHNQRFETLLVIGENLSVRIPDAIIYYFDDHIAISRYGEDLPTVTIDIPDNRVDLLDHQTLVATKQ